MSFNDASHTRGIVIHTNGRLLRPTPSITLESGRVGINATIERPIQRAIINIILPQKTGKGKKRNRTKKKKTPRRRSSKLPDSLPVFEVVCSPPLHNCPSCGGIQQEKGASRVTHQLCSLTSPFFVLKIVRERPACRSCETVGPAEPLPAEVGSSILHESFLSHVITQKTLMGMPVQRIADSMQGLGIEVTSDHIDKQLRALCPGILEVHKAHSKLVFSRGILSIDPTAIIGRVTLGEEVADDGAEQTKEETKTKKRKSKKKGKKKPRPRRNPHGVGKQYYANCALFGALSLFLEFTVIYREGLRNDDFEKAYAGDSTEESAEDKAIRIILADGAAGCEHTARLLRRCIASCHSHARRKFEQAWDYDQKNAEIGVAFFNELFAIEDIIKGFTTRQKKKYRRRHSYPIMKKLRRWCLALRDRVAPSSPLGVAINYVLKRWSGLTMFLKDGRVLIHTNDLERLFRYIARGRHAFHFVSSHRGGQMLAALYSLAITCQLQNIDPFTYFTDVIRRIRLGTDQPEDLVPTIWKQRFYADAKEKLKSPLPPSLSTFQVKTALFSNTPQSQDDHLFVH